MQQIKDGFEIVEVEIDELNLLYEDLVDEDGNVVKRRGDYSERLGLTQCPITGVSIKTFPILHALLQCFNFCLKLLYKLNTGVTSWKKGKILAERVNEVNKRVREIIKNKTGVAVDQPDSTGAGEQHPQEMQLEGFYLRLKTTKLVDCIPQKVREDDQCDKKVYAEFLTNISVILRAISSRSVINTEQLETLRKETSIMFLIGQHLNFYTFKATVLAHSTALINANDSTGLGSLSEEQLDHNNKNLRCYGESLATQNANLSDIQPRLWIKSDPIIRSYRNAIKCSACNGDHRI